MGLALSESTILSRVASGIGQRSGFTWRLNSGVPPTAIAVWAWRSVEALGTY